MIMKLLKEQDMTLQELLDGRRISEAMVKQCKKMIQEHGPDWRGTSGRE